MIDGDFWSNLLHFTLQKFPSLPYHTKSVGRWTAGRDQTDTHESEQVHEKLLARHLAELPDDVHPPVAVVDAHRLAQQVLSQDVGSIKKTREIRPLGCGDVEVWGALSGTF